MNRAAVNFSDEALCRQEGEVTPHCLMGGIEERSELIHAHLVFFLYQSGNALTALLRLHVAGHPFIIPSFDQTRLTI
jgi:hypothetical protein